MISFIYSRLAIGLNITAVQAGDLAIGDTVNATGQDSIAIGSNLSAASFPRSIAIGSQAFASNTSAIAMGDNVTASGITSIAIGASGTAANNTNSIAIGTNVTTGSINTIVMGTAATIGAGVPGTILIDTAIAPQLLFVPNLPTVAGTTLQYNNITGQITEAPSSRRYKENIRDLEVSKHFDKLRPRRFKLKKQHGNRESIGLIAEELVNYYPELVSADKEGKPNSINYELITAILIKEVQQMRKRIVKLEKH